jgi:hypothetical protein
MKVNGTRMTRIRRIYADERILQLNPRSIHYKNNKKMKEIRENPYRTLGLFGNVTEKELQKQMATIRRYAEVGKTKSFDYDFPFLGELKRDSENVTIAASQIEQAKNKALYSLFWFLKTNAIDEMALNYLKDGNVDKATEIWGKLLKDNTITNKNYSAAINLSTLQLGLITTNGSFNREQFRKCVELKGSIIISDVYTAFVQSVAGTDLNKETVLKEFVDEILQIGKPYLDKSKGISSLQLIVAFDRFPQGIRQYVLGKFIDKPINNIENRVEEAKNKRIANARYADQYGTTLYKNTKADIAFLKKVLNTDNIQYQVIVNKVAQEILQCSIDYFNKSNEENSGDNYFEKALSLANYAQSLGASGHTKDKIEESIRVLGEMKFQDCYQAINVLKSIKEAYIQIDKENADIFQSYESISMRHIPFYGDRKIIDEFKVREIIQKEISDNVVRKLATSNNEPLINEFHELLIYLSGRMTQKQILEKIETILYNYLPTTSRLKGILTTQRERKRIAEEERQKEATERRERERIAIEERRKEEVRSMWIGIISIVALIAIVCGIWGVDGLSVLGFIVIMIIILYIIK